ncbi:sarcolemmal membrane-associated protein [Sabethes cyaneus]|uniref:sarcolemmal membrane-associated protein n=1 Tax=Sabethes cyaneus TaxID=53552 RepID=UPI00237E46A9|nr:sarcolemmal membrane-associated protein [Sabethes cyaneus]XP_053684657.1 sarcolemmal membrane-associated protein [Sabethes cyaneus]XP_053684658.1 sarcolemmal membrane-associated protein [Sabethes cyaneus]XP_053684659.1 sarcolemmal membrane-associated protein [Sabethes cyaneus]XP_053684660.1 sarcolemmal membrane-associated protein [Sabethes cyaneus]XP_053684661.1 sarcolemmal membrane-associated protein [Sabethes cyaneus]
MVIINNRDEYLSFLKVPGVRMQTPVVSNNSSTPTTTLNRDTNLQQQQQQQQNQTNNNTTLVNNINNNNNGNGVTISNNNNNGLPGLAKAVLICRQNSHPFNNRTLFLEPHQEVKVGRSVARNRVSENNAIFDCKVLSRNHAVLWYSDGKFFIKDTCSSNGTFINNVRLSQTSTESEPYEVSSGDIVQFGVDVMENSRRETHGCIVATLKLFLPDGRETKASQSIGVGGQSTKIPPVDLYRLNQYIQEANQREQILETKLTSLQKMVEATKQNSALGWQAMIDEDRLLSRIDMLEKKLQYFQKGMTDDKLREEVLKLQDEKHQYQNSAKEALWKVHQERLEATHKLATIEKALCSSEDECSLLREQLNKTQLQLQEVTGRLDALQSQYDEKVASSEELLKLKESEVANLSHEINLLQEKISFYAFYASDEDEQQQQEYNDSAVSDWLLKSDIKKLEGSEDIIKAICNDAESEMNPDGKEINLEDSVMQLQRRILTLERNISLFIETDNRIENENEPNDNTSVTSSSTTSTATAPVAAVSVNANDNGPFEEAMEPLVKSGGEECDGNQNVSTTGSSNVNDSQQMPPSTTESILTTTITTVTTKDLQQKRSAGTKLSAHLSCELNQNVLRRNLKHIKSDCALLLRQVSRTNEDNRKNEENLVAKIKYDELEAELRALKQELGTRPQQDELEKKQRLCESLTEDLASMRIETEELRALNDRCHEEMNRLENELLQKKNVENEKISAMLQQEPTVPVLSDDAVGNTDVKCATKKENVPIPSVIDAETQTEPQEEEEEAPISSNIEEFDYEVDDEEDEDEKTETIDTTEIFVGQRLLDNSRTSLNNSSFGTSDSVTSYSHNINSSSYTSMICSESTPRMVDANIVKTYDSEIGEPNGTLAEQVEPVLLSITSMQQELELINHPDVQREEELIAFKEKYTHLTQENIRLNQQLQKLNDDFSRFKSKSLIKFLMYIAPFIVIVGYIMFNRVS